MYFSIFFIMPRRKTEAKNPIVDLKAGRASLPPKPAKRPGRPAAPKPSGSPVRIGVNIIKTEPIARPAPGPTDWLEETAIPKSDALPAVGFEKLIQPPPRPEIGKKAVRAAKVAGKSLSNGLGATGRLRFDLSAANKHRVMWIGVGTVMLSILVIWSMNIKAIVNPPDLIDIGPKASANTTDPTDDLVRGLTEIKAGIATLKSEMKKDLPLATTTEPAATTTPAIDDRVLLELKDMIENETATATVIDGGRLPE